jgi:hypothetical protein
MNDYRLRARGSFELLWNIGQATSSGTGRVKRFLVRSNRRFQFDECGQQLIRAHDETPSVAAMCVCNPDRSPVGINR